MNKGLFITATGTDIGKTYVTALIVKKLRAAGYRAGYYKAALSGAERTGEGLIPGDAEYVNRIAGIGEEVKKLVSYTYENAVSPHLAAQIEGNPAELKVIRAAYEKLALKYDYLTMEGSGGILCPIRYDDTIHIFLEDIIKELRLSTIIIADAGLGTINSTVLTVEYMRNRDIQVKGIIFNHFHEDSLLEADNRRMVEELTGIPVIALVKDNATELGMDAEALAALYE